MLNLNHADSVSLITCEWREEYFSKGLFSLGVRADGEARLERDGAPVCSARLDPAVWPRLLAAVSSPSEDAAPLAAGQQVSLFDAEHAQISGVVRDEGLRILDALACQLSRGTARRTAARLPRMAHHVTAEPPTLKPDLNLASFGTVHGAPAYVLAGSSPTFELFSMPEGESLGRSTTASRRASSVALGRDLVATGGADGVIRCWNATTAQELHARSGPTGPVAAVAAGPAAGLNLALAAGADSMIRFWNVEDGEELGAVSDWNGAFNDVSLVRVSDLDLLAAGGDDGVVRIWNLADGTAVRTLNGHTGWVNAVATLGTAEYGLVASAGEDRVVRVWDLATGGQIRAFTGHTESVTGLAMGQAGEAALVASCAMNGTVRVWDVATGRETQTWSTGVDWPGRLAMGTIGNRTVIVHAGPSGTVHVRDAVTGAVLRTLAPEAGGGTEPTAIALSDLIAVCYGDGTVRVWDANGTPLPQPGADGAVTSVALSPAKAGTPVLVCGSADGSVRLHDATTGALLHVLTPHVGEVRALHFADDFPDDGTGVLISGGTDTVVRTWDALTGAPRLHLPGHRAEIAAVAAGPARTIASADESGVLQTWDGRTGRPLLATHAYHAPARALAFQSGSAQLLLAAGYADGMIHVLHATTGHILLSRHEQQAGVRALLLTPSTLYAGHDDGTIRGWRLSDGHELLHTTTPHPVLELALSPQGTLYALGPGGPLPLPHPNDDETEAPS